MKIKVNCDKYDFDFITNDSRECDENTAFLLTYLSKKYLHLAKEKTKHIICADDLHKYIPYDIKIIGITGTNGKTTTASIISFVLNKLGLTTATLGTSGFFIDNKLVEKTNNTTPDTLELYDYILKASKKCDFLVMEVSSHAIVQNRIAGVVFDTKVHTNITQDHLDFHKSIQEYRDIKNSFLQNAKNIITNIDDKYLVCKNHHTTYSLKNKSDISAKNINVSQYGIDAVIEYKNEISNLKSHLVGTFNLSNILASIGAIKCSSNASLENICKIIDTFHSLDGRMQVVSKEPLIIVDFAHTPDGMEKVFRVFENKKIIVLFGAGGDRDKSKRALMGEIADKYAQKIYLSNDNPRFENEQEIINQIQNGIKNTDKTKIILDRAMAIKEAIQEIYNNKYDVLLVLGKGNESYQDKNGIKTDFNDSIEIKKHTKHT